MGTVMIRCPKTGRSISTEIEMEVSDFERLPCVEADLFCPHCGQNHSWTRRAAWLQEISIPDAAPRPGEIRIGETASK